MDPLNPVAFYDSSYGKYLDLEEDFIPAAGYADSKEATLRNKAMLMILENSKCDDFDAFIPYLAMSYFDRYISRNPLPNVIESVREEVVFVANCCLLLAWKMRQKTFKVLEFLAKTDMIEHQRHIMTVEFAILNGLKWKMRALTAICFMSMFVREIPVANYIKRRHLNRIIIEAQAEITFTKVKPSLMAAAAILAACKLKYLQFSNECCEFFSVSKYFKQDDLDACCDKICKMCMDKQILMEGDGQGYMAETSQVGGKLQAEESSSSISHRPGKEPVQETSEIHKIEVDKGFVRRPGKEPVSEIKEEPVPIINSENDPDQMKFELKWILWSTVVAKITIDSRLFRPVAVATKTTPVAVVTKTTPAEKAGMEFFEFQDETMSIITTRSPTPSTCSSKSSSTVEEEDTEDIEWFMTTKQMNKSTYAKRCRAKTIRAKTRRRRFWRG